MCAFMWMSVDATFLYRSIVIVFDQSGLREKQLLRASIFVVPFVIVCAAVGATNATAYGGDDICWITVSGAFYGSVVAPMGMSLLYNTCILAAVGFSLHNREKKLGAAKSGKSKEVSILAIVVCLSVLLGLTWMFGFFVLVWDEITLQYIFTILSSLQGFGIFVHVVRGTETKKGWTEKWTSSSTRTTRTSTGSTGFGSNFFSLKRFTMDDLGKLSTLPHRAKTAKSSDVNTLPAQNESLEMDNMAIETSLDTDTLWASSPASVPTWRSHTPYSDATQPAVWTEKHSNSMMQESRLAEENDAEMTEVCHVGDGIGPRK
ncbi:adhesion G protein-coupled receptor E5-like [Sycon ciliatum]|uniref:adhesion G protein-coupled receptor E5-like n=1 Tax=Sycon ciliatum TaxID=27933 RepID=UPI0031F6BE4A